MTMKNSITIIIQKIINFFKSFFKKKTNKIEYINALRDVIRDGTSDHTIVAIGECG